MEQKVSQPVAEHREKWTNQEWADYLGVKKWRVTRLRAIVNTNFIPLIARGDDGKYYLVINRRHDTPSGSYREIPFLSANNGFDTVDECISNANSVLIPNLELGELMAVCNKLPTKVLQLMRIRSEDFK